MRGKSLVTGCISGPLGPEAPKVFSHWQYLLRHAARSVPNSRLSRPGVVGELPHARFSRIEMRLVGAALHIAWWATWTDFNAKRPFCLILESKWTALALKICDVW